MYPHERSLVKEMEEAGEPFALIGVNVGDDLETIQEAVKEEGLNWRSFYIGKKDMTVPNMYKVQGYPTIYIIDAEGKIASVGHDPQEEVIRKLLADMKTP